MHILIIPSWYPSAPGDVDGSFFREQALSLQRQGCKVGVIYPQLRSMRNWRTVIGQYGRDVSLDEGMPTHRYHGMDWLPRPRWLQLQRWLRIGRRLFDQYVMAHGMPDVIHAHSLLYAGCLARDLSIASAIPYLVTEHSSLYARGLLSVSQREWASSAAVNASRAYAVSASFANLLASQLPLTRGIWSEMPNIVRQDFLSIPLRIDNGSKNCFSFLHISTLDAKKSVDIQIKAFSRVFKGDLSVRLVIGGDGPARQSLMHMAVALGIEAQVDFPGRLSRHQVMEHMRACDAFLLSSPHETFGVVLIEAMALGKPVIATRCGGPESIVLEANGILVAVNDVSEMAVAMEFMRNNVARYDPEEIRSTCETRFSEDSVSRRLLSAYSEVMRTHV